MRASFRVGLALAGIFVLGCQSTTTTPLTASLRRSGKAGYLCLGPDGRGAPLKECPRGPAGDTGGQYVAHDGYELHSLITQTSTAEVAVIRMTGFDDDGTSVAGLLDADPSNPGTTHLRVGERPQDLVSTPGGHATFVSVAELGKPGIFALPTSCLLAPKEGEPQRDLTTWAACSLPSAPGAMTVLVDPADAEGRVRESCAAAPSDPTTWLPPKAATREFCATDLREEFGPAGRRKLVVVLPDEGKLVTIDAQELLDREPGSFDACRFESELPLDPDLPAFEIVQPILEEDFGATIPAEEAVRTYSWPDTFVSRPSGLAAFDGQLVVGDQGSPIVHRVDGKDPCQLVEKTPLVAASYNEPERVVTTTKVALSPPSPSGKQYVYAVDELGARASDLAHATASVMVFDVSPGVTSITPKIRSGAALVPQETPDRLAFSAPVKDVAFALLDEPLVDQVTGSGAFGVRCEADPRAPADAPGVLYRPTDDYESGSSPVAYRGLFAYVLLGSGQVAVVDVEDLDADCRRPATTNSTENFNFQGCRNDPSDIPFYTNDLTSSGSPTVTDELSCRIVVPHRARSRVLVSTNEDGTTYAFVSQANPSLVTYPKLSLEGRDVAVSRKTPEGRKSPLMLGVDYSPPGLGRVPAFVHISGTRYSVDSTDNELVIDPGTAEQPSLVLPFVDPRVYPTSEAVTVTYEGDLDGLHRTGQLRFPEGGAVYLEDVESLFCGAGVQGESQTADFGGRRFGLESGAKQRFAENHADYVQVGSSLLLEDDSYWDSPLEGCETEQLFNLCDVTFGDGETDTNTDAEPATLKTTRDFLIKRAFQEHLELEPRDGRTSRLELLRCCFPEPISYRVRGGKQWVARGATSGFRHDVKASTTLGEYDDFECVYDSSPLRTYERGRAFEISSSNCATTDPEVEEGCKVGPYTPDDVVCVLDGEKTPVEPDGRGAECIFTSLSRRFAIYRGREASRRGMSFGFEVTGGFTPQLISLASATSTATPLILPASLAVNPYFTALGVVDTQTRGFLIIDLRTGLLATNFN